MNITADQMLHLIAKYGSDISVERVWIENGIKYYEIYEYEYERKITVWLKYDKKIGSVYVAERRD